MSTENSTSQLEKCIIELEDENKRLHETVAYLIRKLYGSRSEKTSALGIVNCYPSSRQLKKTKTWSCQ